MTARELPSSAHTSTAEIGEDLFSPENFINRLYSESAKLLEGKDLIADFGPQTIKYWEWSGDSVEGVNDWPIHLQKARIYRGDDCDYSIAVGIRPMKSSRRDSTEADDSINGLSFQFAAHPCGENSNTKVNLDYLALINSTANHHGTGEIVFGFHNYLSVNSWATSHLNGSPDIRDMRSEQFLTPDGFESLMDLVADVFDRSFRKPRNILRPSAS